MKKLILLIILVAAVVAVTKLAQAKKAEWSGLTEDEVREKLTAKMGGRMPPEKMTSMQDAIINKMRAGGHLRDQGTEVASA